MHPVLFAIPLDNTELPLFPGLVGLALLGLCLAAFAQFRRIRGLVVFGLALAAVTGYAAHTLGSQTLALSAFEVPTWGFLASVWLILVWQLTQASARRLCLPAREMANCVIVSALGALLLSRLAFVVATLHEQPKLDWLALKQGGLLGIAAVAGASLGAALYLRKHELSIWKWLDVAAPALALGVVLIRSGCYLHGCDYGLRLSADAPEWLAELGTFPRWGDPDQAPVGGALAWVQQVTSGTISPEQLHAQPVHPTQLYEAVTGLVFLGLCWYGIPRRRFDGQLGLSLLLVYALSRFLLDTLRADVPRGLLGPHLELRVYLPLGLALFAIAFAYGPALSIASARQRNLLMLLSLLPALFALWFSWWHTGPASQLSISQWLALLTAGAAAHAWSARARAVQL